MPYDTKVATCCYCGTRAALVLRGRDRHELSCSSCGAPLHDMKLMPIPKADTEAPRLGSGRKSGKAASTPQGIYDRKAQKSDKRKRKASKKRKGRMGRMFRDALDEAFDVIEDIFD